MRNKLHIWAGVFIFFSVCVGCVAELLDRSVSEHPIQSDGYHNVRVETTTNNEWHSITGVKQIIDSTSGRVRKYYKLQLDYDCDLNELVRKANNSDNLGKKIKCRLKLEHSELSDVFDAMRVASCTMTCKYIKSYKFPMDRDFKVYADHPGWKGETWSAGDGFRFLRLPRRFDLVFTLTVRCFESKDAAEVALAIDRNASAFCEDLSIHGNVACNVLVQWDYFVCVDVWIYAYNSEGTVLLLGVGGNDF